MLFGNDKRQSSKPFLSASEAVLYVTDFNRARDFYVSKLGFLMEFADGDPPFFGLVRRDRAQLCLRLVTEPVFVGDIREREQLLSAAVNLESAADINALHREFEAAGVPLVQEPRTDRWGSRNFIIRDPDGNLVMFGGPAG
jgi:catechol 2,3-dioxygenase-like lactoylglutathione lyase family enzyme